MLHDIIRDWVDLKLDRRRLFATLLNKNRDITPPPPLFFKGPEGWDLQQGQEEGEEGLGWRGSEGRGEGRKEGGGAARLGVKGWS